MTWSRAALGEHIYTSFLEAKRIEWASYATFVSQWEVDNYLDYIKNIKRLSVIGRSFFFAKELNGF